MRWWKGHIRFLEKRSYIEKWVTINLLGALAGFVGGLGAIVFRLMIKANSWFFMDLLIKKASFITIHGLNPLYIIPPALGGLIIAPFVFKYAPETRGHGVPEVMEAVALKGGEIRKRVSALKIIVSSITIGSGGSAGREGPIAQIGSSFGSLLGDLFNLDVMQKRLLVVCGLAGGIAGTFNAPLGGMLFGLEVLYRGIGLYNAIPVALASVIGASTMAGLYTPKPSFIAPPTLTFTHYSELFWYFIQGLIFGLIAVAWVKLFYLIEDAFEKQRMPPLLKPGIGGLITGFLGMFFPMYGIMGVGYEGINKALLGEFGITLLIILGIFKMISTASTIGSGGSGGVFAPSLFVGGMFGAAYGLLLSKLTFAVIQHPLTYSLSGMAAIFAAAAQAPLTVIIMIPEMSRDYSLLPPLIVTSTTSFLVSYLFLKGSSIYTLKLEKKGINIKIGSAMVLDHVKVDEIMTKNVITVKPEMSLYQLELLIDETKHHGFPVVDQGMVVAVVTSDDLSRIPYDKRRGMKVRDIMSRGKVIVVSQDETVQEAVDKMYEKKIDRVIVVDRDNPNKVIGILTHTDVIRAYEVAAEKGII